MNRTKAIIFDWGGVLMRTSDHTPRHDWDRRLGLELGSVERVVHGIDSWRAAQMGVTELAAYWQDVQHELNLSDDQLAALQRDFYRADSLDTDLVDLIRRLRQHGIRIGLLSNNILALLDDIQSLNLIDLFDTIVISAQIGVMKPDPAAYHAVLNAMNLTPQQAAFVDDFSENVRGAEAVGMRGILFTPDLNLEAVLEEWLHA